MKNKVSIILYGLLITLLILVSYGCAKSNSGDSSQKRKKKLTQTIQGLKFNSTFPSKQKERILDDIAFLNSIDLKVPSSAPFNPEAVDAASKLRKVLNTPDVSSDSLLDWLSKRFHIILSQSFDVTQVVSRARAEYDRAKIDSLLFSNATPSRGETKIIMSNVGTELYVNAKNLGYVYALDIPGIENKVILNSPLVGLILVGEGLFSLYSEHVGESHSIVFRLTTYFHEAKHCNGNEKMGSLGFQHSTCLTGTYMGKAACDANLNGPYMIGALFVKAYMESCHGTCSLKTMEVLKVIHKDSLERVQIHNPLTALQEATPESKWWWDDTPEYVQ